MEPRREVRSMVPSYVKHVKYFSDGIVNIDWSVGKNILFAFYLSIHSCSSMSYNVILMVIVKSISILDIHVVIVDWRNVLQRECRLNYFDVLDQQQIRAMKKEKHLKMMYKFYQQFQLDEIILHK